MRDIESTSMIWRHVMLALPAIESVPNNHTLDRVGRLVRGLAAELELFHCFYEPELAAAGRGDLEALIASRSAAHKRRLERIADTLRDQHLEVHASVRFDYPLFESIIREVLRRGPNLLIVPATTRAGAGRAGLSYTEARLIEACPCPLLLVKTEQVYSQGPIVAAIDPGHARGKPGQLDESIVAGARTLSYALADAPVRVYHAVAPRAGGVGEQTVAASVRAERQKSYFGECRAEARRIAARYEIPDAQVHVEAGAVESSLPQYARAVGANAVVMGAVSRSYPERALFGYTAEKVLNSLDCDVLIIKPGGFRCPVSRHARARPAAGARAAQALSLTVG